MSEYLMHWVVWLCIAAAFLLTRLLAGIYSELSTAKKDRVKWYLKQLLPFRYVSHYEAEKMDPVTGIVINGKSKITCKWRMWFGRSFAERYYSGWGDDDN